MEKLGPASRFREPLSTRAIENGGVPSISLDLVCELVDGRDIVLFGFI